ncbi:DHH family phosphoesterase [Pontiellaceae bacterium B12219]|nr:DHH family phosphoesterase [Pontiellaceae bacterium B12219]
MTSKALRNASKLSRLKECLQNKRTLLIVMQNFPDPDAIASAVGLRSLVKTFGGIQCSLAHGGTIGRAENRALAKYLKLNLHPLEELQTHRYDAIAMVDAQPRTGNTMLPAHALPDIVIDHHPIRKATRSCCFTDVRGTYGSTSTIIHEYLQQAGIEIKTDLATALLYGIRSDTQDLGRETSRADIDAYLALYPLANKRMLSRILNAPIPVSYFQLFARALESAEVCGSAVLATVDETDNPDMIGEVADLLIRKEDTESVICCGYHEGKALFSIRTTSTQLNAGRMARQVAGPKGTAGGHKGFAGGQISMKNDASEKTWNEISQSISERFKMAVKVSQLTGEKLVP